MNTATEKDDETGQATNLSPLIDTRYGEKSEAAGKRAASRYEMTTVRGKWDEVSKHAGDGTHHIARRTGEP